MIQVQSANLLGETAAGSTKNYGPSCPLPHQHFMGGLALGGFTGPSSRPCTSRLALRGRSRPTAEFTERFSFRGVTCCGQDWWKASASPRHAFHGPARTGGSEALGVPTAGAGAMASANGSLRSSGLGNLELQGEALDFSFSGSFPGIMR
jgi:hypothetical protein